MVSPGRQARFAAVLVAGPLVLGVNPNYLSHGKYLPVADSGASPSAAIDAGSGGAAKIAGSATLVNRTGSGVYEQLLETNAAFRSQRIERECGPLSGSDLKAACIASFPPAPDQERTQTDAHPSEEIGLVRRATECCTPPPKK